MSKTRTDIVGLTTTIVFALCAVSVHAEPTVHASIQAAFHEADRSIEGTVRLSIKNDTGKALDRIPLMLYPNHLRHVSPKLDGGLVRWIYPEGRSAGQMVLNAVQWNDDKISVERIEYPPPEPGSPRKPDTIALVPLKKPLAAGAEGNLTIRFTVTVPIRRGRFGTYERTTVLGGGWFPRPLTDLSGILKELPPDRITADIRLEIPESRGAVLQETIFPVKKPRQVLEVNGLETESVVVIIMDRLETTQRMTSFGTAIHVHQTLPYHKTTWKETLDDKNGLPQGLPDPARIDYSGRIIDVAEKTAGLIRSIAPECPLSNRLVLVDIPAWDRMVQFGPGPVLVSDRLYRLLTVDDGLFFHDLALVRSVAPALVYPALMSEPVEHRFVAADTAGVLISEHYSRTIHDKRRTVKEILGFASMIPSVDNLLYAPQIPFKEVYFKPIEEPDPLRDEVWYFTNHLPRGKRIAGKLVDLVGRESALQALGRFLDGQSDFDETISDVIPGDSTFFFEQWFGVYPKVNYRVDNVHDIPLDGGRYEHRFDVIREGVVLREPVVIHITDDNDTTHELIWDSIDRKETLSWISDAPVDDVVIDPHGRLVEAGELTRDHPLSDNSDKLPLRPPMFTRLLVWADATTQEPVVQLGFWLRRKYDTSNVINLDLDYTSKAYGALLSYYRFFGKKRTLNARTWGFGPAISVTRYRAIDGLQFSSSERKAATMGAFGLSLGRDTRVYGWDPIDGSSFSVGASYATGMDSDTEMRHVFRLQANGGRIFAPGLHHTLALYGGITAIFGKPVAAHLTSLSDRYMLRGFESDETYGRLKLFGVLEYRHTLLDATGARAPLFIWLDRFQGALFVGGGSVSKPSGDLVDGLFSSDRIYTEVGYGIRSHLLLFGVQQYLVAVDVAIPVTPTKRTVRSLGRDGAIEETSRLPFKVIIGIIQTF